MDSASLGDDSVSRVGFCPNWSRVDSTGLGDDLVIQFGCSGSESCNDFTSHLETRRVGSGNS